MLALIFLFGQVVQGALFLELGREVFNGIAAGVELGFLCGRVNFDQQLAFFDFVTHLNVNRLDLPGGLRAHVHILPRLQRAKCRYAAFNVTAGDGHGVISVAASGQEGPCRQRGNHQ